MRSQYSANLLGVALFIGTGLLLPWPPVMASIDPDSDIDLADFAAMLDCLAGPGATPGASCTMDADLSGDGDVDLADYAALQLAFTGVLVPPAIPAQFVSLDLIGVHDPGSEQYDGDCVACHAAMTNEVAMDGITPTAHSQMLVMIPYVGNERCLVCHGPRTDFVSYSTGGLRKQVNLELAECTWCHGSWTGDLAWYVRPE